MEAKIQEDTHFILGLISDLCQFEDRNEFMLAVLVEQLQRRNRRQNQRRYATIRHSEG